MYVLYCKNNTPFAMTRDTSVLWCPLAQQSPAFGTKDGFHEDTFPKD